VGETGVGEIEIGGAQPAGSYLLADGTVEPIGRLRTGDLGYLDKDGFLIITGRAKDVIIRGGVNIAPMEIDNVLAARTAATARREDPAGRGADTTKPGTTDTGTSNTRATEAASAEK
jgi:acyl-CoA synthetase (AMP-forming)/AMP-acid ligase II